MIRKPASGVDKERTVFLTWESDGVF